ncbi:MAG: cell division protein ZapA [Bacteroidota bacterium]
MKPIKVTILGKQYPLKVEDHEEENMVRIAKYVDERFQTYKNQLANQPDHTVMSLAALSLAEELFEARASNSELERTEELTMERVNKSLERLLETIKS